MARATAASPAGRPRAKRRPERIGGTLVRDPQCGTYLPKDRALAATSSGETNYFCSDACRDAWAAHRR
jgi:YHS domain-containing protein